MYQVIITYAGTEIASRTVATISEAEEVAQLARWFGANTPEHAPWDVYMRGEGGAIMEWGDGYQSAITLRPA